MANIAPLPNAAGLGTSNPQRLALDNLIRRELKVGDPNDPMQVAQALLDRYKTDPRAAAIAQEARGLPFLQTTAAQPGLVAVHPSSSAAEWQQALDDIESDLRTLTSDAILKDVSPELQGWAQAIRSAVREGYNAACSALDPRNRDKAFGIRRQLNDYARVARLVGALTAGVTQYYRKLAQSLDEAAAVLLVAMGESLANVGFGGDRYLLQAPYTELQTRRDAVIYALRNLVGATQQAYGPNDWPRGLDAYRALYQQLEAQGQGDLRALLEENELSRTMDELIQRAAHGNTEGLRALGSTALIDLTRVRRFVSVAHQLAKPESPPLAAFLEALMLFAESFDSSGGIRLLRIARPPILLYGLYGMQSLELADERLLLIQKRGVLAGQLDCYTACDCSDDKALCQIVLDKVLYDLDRAIDLYALGNQDLLAPECRASAYSFVIDAALLQCCDFTTTRRDPCNPDLKYGAQDTTCSWKGQIDSQVVLKSIQISLLDIRGLLRPLPGDAMLRYWKTAPDSYDNACSHRQRHQELCIQRAAELSLETLVDTMAPGCIPHAALFDESNGVLQRLMRRALNLSHFNLYLGVTPSLTVNSADRAVANEVGIIDIDAFNRKYKNQEGTTICDLIDRANDCEPVNIKIPPHYESTLNSITHDVDSDGTGR
ncbi:hypothetical protein HA520_08570 [Azotobacter chroococcum]|uniref:Uncharacterized protein n=1 Tax=Azotobacter chroococcum TaxID=353 RepID=A0AA44C887_9GAMM|nr:hypothetical protein [Azotobacter chroococcum]NHN77343.1 hypothetical protein [Azotobacter chroococcum]